MHLNLAQESCCAILCGLVAVAVPSDSVLWWQSRGTVNSFVVDGSELLENTVGGAAAPARGNVQSMPRLKHV